MRLRRSNILTSALFLCFLLPTTLWAQEFARPVPYPTGGSAPNGVAVGDLNGDGHLDVVVANTDLLGTVAVLLGEGNGKLQPAVTYPAGTYPQFVLLADFNGDGHLDVAVGNRAIGGPGFVTVLLGNGDGTLQAPISYLPFTDAFSLATGDFNGDGILDIAVGDTASGSILLGNGDGTFREGSPIGATNACFFAVADFNRDGKLDLVSADNTSSTIQLFLGNGNGKFTLHARYPVATPPIALVAGDFNGDGVPDFAAADEAVNDLDSNVTVFESSFGGYVKKEYPFGDEPRMIVAADINSDGHLDLVTENEFNGTVDVFINSGRGAFKNPLVMHDGGITAAGVAVGDLNGDGKPDIVVTDGQIPGAVHVLLQD